QELHSFHTRSSSDMKGEMSIATVMSVTLSTDHRCVDGALGAELLQASACDPWPACRDRASRWRSSTGSFPRPCG
ncbi:2-oxo acid dehydrogenase subunit E2, partial [Rhizobium ruizarguesonis]